jgi:aryl-alcohol dehydrogenase-like predicted oxidoreductase
MLDRLCDEGLIRHYGWSTDDPERAAVFGKRPRSVAIQFDMNVFEDAPAMLEACDGLDCAGLVRLPLAMGFLTGKFTSESRLPRDDIRSNPPSWLRYFNEGGGAAAEWTKRLASIREILTSGGRTLAQGALAWVWGRSERTIPIPGIRTVAQAEENLGTIRFGPLEPDRMREMHDLLERA